MNNKLLAGKTAVVTGSSSGIGRAIAEAFAREGASVMLNGFGEAAQIESLRAGLEKASGAKARYHGADMTKPAEIADLIATAERDLGRVDILVNNAGTNVKARRMRELTVEAWNQLVRTNLDGAFYCIKEVLPQMLARKDGVIVNVNSISGKRPYPLAGAGYAAGKFGLHALAGCLANEELESGIRVSSIYPGEIDTPILEVRPTPVTAEQRAKIIKAEDVAGAILFVAALPPHVSVPELIIKPTAQGYS